MDAGALLVVGIVLVTVGAFLAAFSREAVKRLQEILPGEGFRTWFGRTIKPRFFVVLGCVVVAVGGVILLYGIFTSPA